MLTRLQEKLNGVRTPSPDTNMKIVRKQRRRKQVENKIDQKEVKEVKETITGKKRKLGNTDIKENKQCKTKQLRIPEPIIIPPIPVIKPKLNSARPSINAQVLSTPVKTSDLSFPSPSRISGSVKTAMIESMIDDDSDLDEDYSPQEEIKAKKQFARKQPSKDQSTLSPNSRDKFIKFVTNLEQRIKHQDESGKAKEDSENESDAEESSEEDSSDNDEADSANQALEEEEEKLPPELKTRYNEVKNYLSKKEPTLERIFRLNCTQEEKSKMADVYSVYNTMREIPIPSMEKITFRNMLNDMIRTHEHKTQEDVKLEEQLRESTTDIKKMGERIIHSEMPMRQKSIVYSKFLNSEEVELSGDEKGKLYTWIEWALSIPQTIKPSPLEYNNAYTILSSNPNSIRIRNNRPEIITRYLCNLQQTLDQRLYGLERAKENILMVVNNLLTNPGSGGHSLALVGPPGVGKTELVRSLASVLEIPFEQISLGGVKDSSFLDGFSYTYEGATPGIIAKTMKKLRYKNGIIFFDEFDKIADTPQGLEVSYNLLHIVDTTQNCDFRDKYLDEITIDLSKIWFIYSLNDERLIDGVLKDRINIIKLDGYLTKDKVQIAKKFLIPRALAGVDMKGSDVIFEDRIIEYIIESKSLSESGVRQLNNCIQQIIKKINLMRISKNKLRLSYFLKDFKLPLTLNNEMVNKLLEDKENRNTSYLSMYL